MTQLNRRMFLSAVLPVVAAACACSDEDENECEQIHDAARRDACNAARNPTPGPTPVPEPAKVHEFEFRVVGTVRRVDISHSSTSEGTTLLTTDLPWFATIRSTRTLMFMSLVVSSALFEEGTLTAQLFVDGQLFREAHASGFQPSVSISGQWSA
jgi:hypothetical protein